MVDINRMMRGSVAIYCEAPKAVADDISYMLRTGAEEIETLRSRVARLEEALPDPDKLEMLARWFDIRHPADASPEVQIDLRKWAKKIRCALEEK